MSSKTFPLASGPSQGKAPAIGVTMDYQEAQTYAKVPWFALRRNYSTSVQDHGAIPYPLVPHEELCEAYIEAIDGLVITGGDFDIDPAFYGESILHDSVKPVPLRTSFELKMVTLALARRLPVLGICGGMQVINVALGGTLVQHIPDVYPDGLDHSRGYEALKGSHHVTPMPNTLLASIVGQTDIWVNTSHHQSVKDAGKGVVLNAMAPDGVIEGIEVPDHPFCLGVQWHPEYICSEADTKIFQAFVKAARDFAARKKIEA